MRIVIDYRPALRARSGVGEYIHQLARELSQNSADEITLFSSSWKDRPAPELAADIPLARMVDRRIPVQALNMAWHRLGWPPIEMAASGTFDVAHSPHPLLLPTRSAAQVVTIHDVHFLTHPERTSREIRRDYPELAADHARRADRIIVSSRFAASEVTRALNVPPDKLVLCPAGAPRWKTPPATSNPRGYILFVGTLDKRKNIGGLLEAYGRLLARFSPATEAPRLVIAGSAVQDSQVWLEAIVAPPLAGHVDYLGYVDADRRERLFKGALLLVLPSFEEGFGLPALEAMSAGVPVVASARGSLPEVVGDAGLLIDPEDPASLMAAMERMVEDADLQATCVRRGLERAAQFTWTHTARAVRRAYEEAVHIHAHRR